MQDDVPLTVPLDAFTQPIQPPLPPGLEISKGLITIPASHPGAGLGKGMRNLFDLAQLDQRPVLKVALRPDYPFELRRSATTGSVTVEFIVDTAGNVVLAQVLRSTHEGFERPALRAVEKWKFRPGRKAGRAVNTRVQQVITFNLDEF